MWTYILPILPISFCIFVYESMALWLITELLLLHTLLGYLGLKCSVQGPLLSCVLRDSRVSLCALPPFPSCNSSIVWLQILFLNHILWCVCGWCTVQYVQRQGVFDITHWFSRFESEPGSCWKLFRRASSSLYAHPVSCRVTTKEMCTYRQFNQFLPALMLF